MPDRSIKKVAQELNKSQARVDERASKANEVVVKPHIERILRNDEKRVKGYCGGKKYNISKESAFIIKCESVNRMLNYDLTDRIKRDQIRAQQAPGLTYNFTIYPSNIKKTLAAILQT